MKFVVQKIAANCRVLAPLLLSLALFQGCHPLWWITEPLNERLYSYRGDTVDKKYALNLYYGAVLNLHRRCPSFMQSGMNPLLNLLALPAEGCGGMGGSHEPDLWTGCVRYDFVSRDGAERCALSIESIPCVDSDWDPGNMNNPAYQRKEPRTGELYWSAYTQCSIAFYNKPGFPMIFF